MTKIILGIAGEIVSGKGTTAEYVCDHYNGSSHRFSSILKDILNRTHLEVCRENLQKMSTALREYFFDDLLSMAISKDVENDKNKIIAVDGVRRLADIEYLKKLSGFKLVYIETDIKKRYERITSRREKTDDAGKTFEEFQKDHEKEAELQIRDLKNHADFVIDNNGSLDELYKQIDEIINKLK